jgi:hypothetical protein
MEPAALLCLWAIRHLFLHQQALNTLLLQVVALVEMKVVIEALAVVLVVIVVA